MYVCNCNAVTEREIIAAASLGCSTLEDLRRLNACEDCGGEFVLGSHYCFGSPT